MENYSPEDWYHKEKNKHNEHLDALMKKRSKLGWIRFMVFIITIAGAYRVFLFEGWYGALVIITGIGILLYLVSKDVNNNESISHTKKLIKINEEELESLKENYSFRDEGNDFLQDQHDYANDLDLFGKHSLYQMVNRCQTEQGRKLLANIFLHSLPVNKIKEKQSSIVELTDKNNWRQEFQAIAQRNKVTLRSEQKAVKWLNEEETHFIHPAWKIIVPVYSVITIFSVFAVIWGIISVAVFSFLLLVYIMLSGILIKRAAKSYNDLSEIIKEISVAKFIIGIIEKEVFKSDYLKNIIKAHEYGNMPASIRIKELEKILGRFDLLLNMIMNLILNSFLLWGVRQMMALNTWRKNNKEFLPGWFALIAEFEVLNSFAALKFNHPDWTFPVFVEEHFTLKGKSIGHPQIPENKRVNNDFIFNGQGKIGLITGSNMAGKSTFLRSLGVNIVLAQAGAPVCANQFILSGVRLMSSMRIADNLAENTSTFYAELKKLKTLIDAVNSHEKVFILLDEILRGTNSLDRHAGSEALISQFIKEKTAALIATHDVELSNLKLNFPDAIENYHFDVQVEGEELYFDYKLKEGVCTSLNASILMKKIGINN